MRQATVHHLVVVFEPVVKQLEIIETAKMPQVAAQEAYSWKPSLMTGFLEKFLTFIRDVMAKVEDVAYVFEWNPEWEGICFTFDPDKTKGKSQNKVSTGRRRIPD